MAEAKALLLVALADGQHEKGAFGWVLRSGNVGRGGVVGGRDVGGLSRGTDVLPTLINLCNLRTDDGLIFDGISQARALREGDAGATDRMSERIGELGLADVVRLPGLIDTSTRNKLLAAADVFLLPSHGENFPMVVLEAMAAGLPIVATRVGAVPEMIAHGETGLLIEPKDPEAIAEAVCELLDGPERAAALGRQARRRFEELYEVDGPISKMWAEQYNATAGAK